MIKSALNSIDDMISMLALVGVIVLTGVNVILRYVFNSPIAWTTEIVLGLFIWFVFMGVSSAMKRDGHVGVDYFMNKMPKVMRFTGEILRVAAIYFVLVYVFIYLGSQLTFMSQGKQTSILGVSYQFINIAVPIGGAFTAIHFTRKTLKSYNSASQQKEGDS